MPAAPSRVARPVPSALPRRVAETRAAGRVVRPSRRPIERARPVWAGRRRNEVGANSPSPPARRTGAASAIGFRPSTVAGMARTRDHARPEAAAGSGLSRPVPPGGGASAGHPASVRWAPEALNQRQQIVDLVIGNRHHRRPPDDLYVTAERIRCDVADRVLDERLRIVRPVDEDERLWHRDAVVPARGPEGQLSLDARPAECRNRALDARRQRRIGGVGVDAL